MIVDVARKDEALALVPPAFRSRTRVAKINSFTLELVKDILARHRLGR